MYSYTNDSELGGYVCIVDLDLVGQVLRDQVEHGVRVACEEQPLR